MLNWNPIRAAVAGKRGLSSRYRTLPCLLLLVVLAFAIPAGACRYSVREVGFVNLEDAPYRFYGLIEGPALLDVYKRAAYTQLLDTSIDIEIVDTLQTPNHPALEYMDEDAALPAGVFVSPEGFSHAFTLDPADGSFEADASRRLDELVASPIRTAIQDEMIESFAVVLLIHGGDAAQDSAARKVVQDALTDITANMNQLDKPVEEPAKLVELPVSARENEAVLLWSLGLQSADLDGPRVAVLFGKARRMGGVLRGGKITRDELVRVLALVGTSCECGLDRKWMQGTMLPMRWSTDLDAKLANHLGFDPESPLVKMEISQIIAKGMSVNSTNNYDSLLGYRESSLAAAAAAGSPASTSAAPSTNDAPYFEDVPLTSGDAYMEDVPLEEEQVAKLPPASHDGEAESEAVTGIAIEEAGAPLPDNAANSSMLPVYAILLVGVANAALIAFIVLRARKQRA